MSNRRDFTWGVQLAANFGGGELAKEAQRLGVPVSADKDALAEAIADRLNMRGECFGGAPWPGWWLAERGGVSPSGKEQP